MQFSDFMFTCSLWNLTNCSFQFTIMVLPSLYYHIEPDKQKVKVGCNHFLWAQEYSIVKLMNLFHLSYFWPIPTNIPDMLIDCTTMHRCIIKFQLPLSHFLCMFHPMDIHLFYFLWYDLFCAKLPWRPLFTS